MAVTSPLNTTTRRCTRGPLPRGRHAALGPEEGLLAQLGELCGGVLLLAATGALLHALRRVGPALRKSESMYIEVLFVKVTVFILLLFASLPDCGQNQTAVSDEQHSLSDF